MPQKGVHIMYVYYFFSKNYRNVIVGLNTIHNYGLKPLSICWCNSVIYF